MSEAPPSSAERVPGFMNAETFSTYLGHLLGTRLDVTVIRAYVYAIQKELGEKAEGHFQKGKGLEFDAFVQKEVLRRYLIKIRANLVNKRHGKDKEKRIQEILDTHYRDILDLEV